MINFEFIKKIVPKDDKIGNIYAIYGCDTKDNQHFLVVGGAEDGDIPVIDISTLNHDARIFNMEDSAIDVAESFGLFSNIKFFYQAEDFDLELDFWGTNVPRAV